MEESKVIELPIKRLKCHERNPRKIDREAMEKLCESMKRDPEFLERRPILCYPHENKIDYVVYAGNQRLRAAKKLGWELISCIVDEFCHPDIIKRRIILDNKTSGDWDYDILSADYDVDELFEMGFTEKELFDEDSNKEAKPPELKATIKFSDADEMDEIGPKLEDFCEVHRLKLSLGK